MVFRSPNPITMSIFEDSGILVHLKFSFFFFLQNKCSKYFARKRNTFILQFVLLIVPVYCMCNCALVWLQEGSEASISSLLSPWSWWTKLHFFKLLQAAWLFCRMSITSPTKSVPHVFWSSGCQSSPFCWTWVWPANCLGGLRFWKKN